MAAIASPASMVRSRRRSAKRSANSQARVSAAGCRWADRINSTAMRVAGMMRTPCWVASPTTQGKRPDISNMRAPAPGVREHASRILEKAQLRGAISIAGAPGAPRRHRENLAFPIHAARSELTTRLRGQSGSRHERERSTQRDETTERVENTAARGSYDSTPYACRQRHGRADALPRGYKIPPRILGLFHQFGRRTRYASHPAR